MLCDVNKGTATGRKRKNWLLLPDRVASETFSFRTHNKGTATFVLKVTFYMEEKFRILCETLIPDNFSRLTRI